MPSVDPKPGEAGDDVANDSHVHQAAFPNGPPSVRGMTAFHKQSESALLSWDPAPKRLPGLVGQMPPRIVPTKLKSVAKQTIP
jgi:hypothetical protein